MPTAEQMTAAVDNYIDRFNANDLDGLVALFAEDAIVEDPIGTPLKEGRQAIRDFYQMSLGTGAKLTYVGPTCPTGADLVAYVMYVIVPINDVPMRFDVIETFRVRDDGKISEMRAYFGETNIRPV